MQRGTAGGNIGTVARGNTRLVVVLDSTYVCKGIVERLLRWRHHGWRNSSREVGHRDLWGQSCWLRGQAGDWVQINWLPSHLGVEGNEGVDELAQLDCLRRPNNRLSVQEAACDGMGRIGTGTDGSDRGRAAECRRGSGRG